MDRKGHLGLSLARFLFAESPPEKRLAFSGGFGYLLSKAIRSLFLRRYALGGFQIKPGGFPDQARDWRSKVDRSQIGASVASLADYSLVEALEKIREMGFESVELLAFEGARHSIGDLGGFWFDELTEKERDRLKEAVGAFGYVALHAPFIDMPLFTHNIGIKREAMSQIKQALEAAWYLGSEMVTVHANQKTFFELEEFWSEMVDTFRELGDFAQGCGVRLGIETGYPNTVRDYLKLFLDINHKAVGATVDVGHIVPYVPRKVLRSKEGVQAFNDTLMEIVRMLGSKVLHIHVHDVRKEDWRDHRTAGRGIVDFDRLFGFLAEIGYEGLFELELEEEDRELALWESKDFLEELVDKYGEGTR